LPIASGLPETTRRHAEEHRAAVRRDRKRRRQLFKTNVWRLYGRSISASGPTDCPLRRRVGTSSFSPGHSGGIFGFGLKRNVLDLYRFACRNYRPGDHLFGFGFSRGAFTIRIGPASSAGRAGPYHGNEAWLERDTVAAYRVYRGRYRDTIGLVTPLRWLRDAPRGGGAAPPPSAVRPAAQIPVDRIRFSGVGHGGGLGGPSRRSPAASILALAAVDADRFMSAKGGACLSRARLDDERNAFWPVLWDEQHVSGPPADSR